MDSWRDHSETLALVREPSRAFNGNNRFASGTATFACFMKRPTLSTSSKSSKSSMNEEVQQAVADVIKESDDKTVEIKPANQSKGISRTFLMALLIGGAIAVGYWLKKSEKPSEKLQETVSKTADRTKKMTEQTADNVQQSGETLADRVEEESEKAGEKVQKAGEKTAEKTEKVSEKAAEKTEEAGEKAEEAGEKAEEASEKVDEGEGSSSGSSSSS